LKYEIHLYKLKSYR